MSKSDLPYCLLIQKYTSNILKYTEGMDSNDLKNSPVTYDACILNFINIGEAVKNLSDSFKTRHPQIPFTKILGLRNIAAHSYEGIEISMLFITIKNDIPNLNDIMNNILRNRDFE